jgi:hypothetical protein
MAPWNGLSSAGVELGVVGADEELKAPRSGVDQ